MHAEVETERRVVEEYLAIRCEVMRLPHPRDIVIEIRERDDDARDGVHKPDAVVVPVCHNNQAARGGHGDSCRVVEVRCRAEAVRVSSFLAFARKRGDGIRGGVHEPDAVVVHIGHNDNAA